MKPDLFTGDQEGRRFFLKKFFFEKEKLLIS
jgi:hypothetical protein